MIQIINNENVLENFRISRFLNFMFLDVDVCELKKPQIYRKA